MTPEAPLRNFGILAHVDAGKTTLSERILFLAGVEHRMGEVHEGTAVMDWEEEERARGITIGAAVTHLEWRDHLVQLVDTPGHVDFTVEVERCLRVLDGAVVLLDGVEGVQPQTEAVVRRARAHGLPLLAMVNKLDRRGADFAGALAELQERIHPGAVAVHWPLHDAEGRFVGVVDLVAERGLVFPEGEERSPREVAPPDSGEAAEAWREARDRLCSLAAEGDAELETRWLEEGRLEADELRAALGRATRAGRLVPVLAGSALRPSAAGPVLDAVVDWLPGPEELPPVVGVDAEGRRVERAPRPDEPCAALVFKYRHDRHGGLLYLRVYSGVLEEGRPLVAARTGAPVRLRPLYRMHADHRERGDRFGPGAIVATPGVGEVRTGDTLHQPGAPIVLEPPSFPAPVLRRGVEVRDPADRSRLEEALRALEREDPTLRAEGDADSGSWILAGMGELHLEVAAHRLEREFGLAVRLGELRVQHLESVAAPCRGMGRAETLGQRPQRLELDLELTPLEPGAPNRLETTPAVLEVVGPEAAAELREERTARQLHGAHGHPAAGLRIRVVGARLEPASGTATGALCVGALQDGVRRALAESGVLLEPMAEVEVVAPQEHVSAVLADLQQRRADIRSLDMAGQDRQRVRARVPFARLLSYPTALRSLTRGQAAADVRPGGFRARSADSGAGGP